MSTPKTYDMFAGLNQDTLDAIAGLKVTGEMIESFVGHLSGQRYSANALRQKLLAEPWFQRARTADTQLRFMRNVRTAANLAGYPVISDNDGYRLGTWAEVARAAERSARLAEGHFKRAATLRDLAARYMNTDTVVL